MICTKKTKNFLLCYLRTKRNLALPRATFSFQDLQTPASIGKLNLIFAYNQILVSRYIQQRKKREANPHHFFILTGH